MDSNLGQSGLLNIGTANFGSQYGIGNFSGGLADSDLTKIFSQIKQNPKIGIDTASAYAMSEETIGKYMNFKSNKVNTKVSPECYSHPKLMVKSVENSLLKTKQTKFNTVYLHGGEINNSSFRESITEGLLKIKELELCENIGVSCYTEDEILKSSQNFPIVQAFQIPENILDQRLKNSNEVMNLSRQGIKFEIRSVFLQGSLLINNNQLPSFLIKYKTYYENLVSTANNLKISVFDLALNYVMSIPWKSSIVVGVNNFDQFEKLTSYQYLNYNLEKLDRLKAPQDLSDPRNWKI